MQTPEYIAEVWEGFPKDKMGSLNKLYDNWAFDYMCNDMNQEGVSSDVVRRISLKIHDILVDKGLIKAEELEQSDQDDLPF